MDKQAITIPNLEALDLTPKPWVDTKSQITDIAGLLASPKVKEHWRYTSATRLLNDYIEHSNKAVIHPLLDIEHTNGELIIEDFSGLNVVDLKLVKSSLGKIDPVRFPLSALKTLSSTSGYLITARTNPTEEMLLKINTTGQLVILKVENGANISIIENIEAKSFSNSILLIDIGAESKVTHARSALSDKSIEVSLSEVYLAKKARYCLEQYYVGSVKRRSDTHITLTGDQSKAFVTGAYVTGPDQHLDQNIIVEHQGKNTESIQQINGIGRSRSQSSFLGRIHIHDKAKFSDAKLDNKNLALGENVTINAKPELEIYTNEVSCSHGATVGQLDEEQLFYLQSRSINKETAIAILSQSFIKSCIKGKLTELVTKKFNECLI
mgnify:CR=1 FL=1